MLDLLLNYEHKVREIESLCLIKIEMENRGYKVAFSCTYDEDRVRFKYFKKAKVVVASTLYNDACLFEFVYRISGYTKKVVNLQWEQSLTNFDESNKDFYQNPKGFAKEAVHLCWGEASKNRLLKNGVPEDRAIVVGPIQMDLLNPFFLNYYETKSQLAKKFNLDDSKEWILFISSFTYTNMTKETYEEELKCYGERLNEFKELSIKSKAEILKWIEDALKLYPNKLFIYRPHPSEKEDQRLNYLLSNYPNFRVINDLSVKQWIKTSEKIFTWYSTAAAEVYFSNKNFQILRPFEIPFDWEVTIYNNSKKLTCYEDYIFSIENNTNAFPLDLRILNSYYNINKELTSTIRICDILEQMILTDNFDMRKHRSNLKIYITYQRVRHRLFFIIKEFLTNLNKSIFIFKNINDKLVKHVSIMNRMQNDRIKNQVSKKELEKIVSKIKFCFNE
jgi:surface carbohydrate biosynthesis protein